MNPTTANARLFRRCTVCGLPYAMASHGYGSTGPVAVRNPAPATSNSAHSLLQAATYTPPPAAPLHTGPEPPTSSALNRESSSVQAHGRVGSVHGSEKQPHHEHHHHQVTSCMGRHGLLQKPSLQVEWQGGKGIRQNEDKERHISWSEVRCRGERMCTRAGCDFLCMTRHCKRWQTLAVVLRLDLRCGYRTLGRGPTWRR